ncbi:MmgE/PrpD family protein [SAR202 cluster bacterium AD-804-J14_MRT_500m]|nr:MmgE/PrpD family protein [SAR202 cluster bacterium AD-804-J14_MRT_500m]
MHETRQLAEFAVQTEHRDLPAPVVQAMKVYVLDNLAAGLVGSATPWAAMVAKLANEVSPTGPCSLFGTSQTTTPSYAALVNGTMIGGFECDHAFLPGSCHPSAAVFPAVMAIAQRNRLDGATFLSASAIGYEVICRIGLAATRSVEDKRGFHGPGTNAPFGGAIGAGKALKLESQQMIHSLGIAGSHGAGLLEFVKEGAMTKRIHVARGAQTGLESAMLAANGFTGPSTVLEGHRGFLQVYSPDPKPDLLLDGLGENWKLLDILVKAYPCHASFHAVIDVIWRFLQNNQVDPDQVKSVRIVGTEKMMEARFCDKEPTSILGAQYSLPFSVAIALLRDVGDPLSFSEATLWDPNIRSLAGMVELSTTAGLAESTMEAPPIVVLTIADKTFTLQANDWKGAPTNPYTFSEMAEKFRRYARNFVTEADQEEVISRVEHLEYEANVGELMQLLGGRQSN